MDQADERAAKVADDIERERREGAEVYEDVASSYILRGCLEWVLAGRPHKR